MIERQMVDGRPATVAYLAMGAEGFEPADKASASMAKLIFDDGMVVFVELD